MKPMHLKYSEFYITNVCNQNCENCNRFNNYAFKGHLLWDDHKDEYAKWAKLVNIDLIGILGGEPFGNPDMMNWIHGIAELWPKSSLTIVTNGTQFDRWPNLYDDLSIYGDRMQIEIYHHTPMSWAYAVEKHSKFLKNPRSYAPYRENRKITHDADMQMLQWRDKSGMNLKLAQEWHFATSSLIRDQDNKLSLQNSDPDEAAKICDFNNSGCHHFINGKLYKCGVVALLPEFIKQFKVDMDTRQQQLIDSYVPASADWSSEDLSQFIDDLNNKKTIPQCNLCPANKEISKFSASTKKIKIEEVHP